LLLRLFAVVVFVCLFVVGVLLGVPSLRGQVERQQIMDW